MALIDWVSKKQSTVETSVFGAKFVFMKNGSEKLWGLQYKLCMMGNHWPDLPLSMLTINPKWQTHLDLNQPWKRNVTPSTTMRCESQLLWVNHLSLMSTLVKTCQTLWPKWPAVVNAVNLLVTSFMTSLMSILNSEARPANHNQLILRGLKKSARGYCTYDLLFGWEEGVYK